MRRPKIETVLIKIEKTLKEVIKNIKPGDERKLGLRPNFEIQ